MFEVLLTRVPLDLLLFLFVDSLDRLEEPVDLVDTGREAVDGGRLPVEDRALTFERRALSDRVAR